MQCTENKIRFGPLTENKKSQTKNTTRIDIFHRKMSLLMPSGGEELCAVCVRVCGLRDGKITG